MRNLNDKKKDNKRKLLEEHGVVVFLSLVLGILLIGKYVFGGSLNAQVDNNNDELLYNSYDTASQNTPVPYSHGSLSNKLIFAQTQKVLFHAKHVKLKDTSESQLLDAVKTRHDSLVAALDKDPSIIISNALPKDVRDNLPASAQALVEQDVSYTGNPKWFHHDDFVNKTDTNAFYLVTSDGKEHELKITNIKDFPFKAGITVQGLELDGKVVVTSVAPEKVSLDKVTGFATASINNPSLSLGIQKRLVVIYSFFDDSLTFTEADARSMITRAVQNYKDASFGNSILTPDVYWIKVQRSSTKPCDAADGSGEAALRVLGVDPSTYPDKVFLQGLTPGACYTSQGGSASVFADPIYGMISDAEGGGFNIPDLYLVLMHEYGHTLGFSHSNALGNCGGVALGPNCQGIEYKDVYEVMSNNNYNNVEANVNAGHRDWATWFTASGTPQIQTVSTSGTYTLLPIESQTPGLKAIRIPKIYFIKFPATDPTAPRVGYYTLEFRQPIGADTGFAGYPNMINGVIFHLEQGVQTQASNGFNGGLEIFGEPPELIDMTPATEGAFFDQALGVGKTYTDSALGLTATVLSVNSSAATVKISFVPTSGSHIVLSSNTLSFAANTLTTPPAQTVVLSNSGSSASSWTATTNAVWCHVSPSSGSTSSGGSTNLLIFMDQITKDGNYNCIVTVSDFNSSIYNPFISASDSVAYASTGSCNTGTPPAIDNFTNAKVISGGGGGISGSNTGATKESGEPIIAGPGGCHSIWYKWTATFNGKITFQTTTYGVDTILGAFTGSGVSSLTPIAQNDDYNGDVRSYIYFNAVAGTTYYIGVDGYKLDSGSFFLKWQEQVPPTVSITSPVTGATVSGITTVTASAADNVGIGSLVLFVNNINIGTITISPYSFSWDTAQTPNGSAQLVVLAWDVNSNAAYSDPVTVTVNNTGSPDITPPTTTIISPVSGAPVSGTTTVSANASDDVGVTKVELYINGILLQTSITAPYTFSWNTNSMANGGATLTTKAYDAAGNVGSSSVVNVTVSNAVIPHSHISLTPASLNFFAVSGGSAPAPQTLTIANTGSATLNWTGTTNQTWCHMAPASGSVAVGGSGSVSISLDAPSSSGTFSCTVSISDPNADNSPQTASLTYTVTSLSQAHIVLSPTNLSFSTISGNPPPAPQTLIISNTGTATLNWVGSTDQTWCHVSLPSGSVALGSSTAASVFVDTLNAGSFFCTVSVSGNADNTPQTIAVTYKVSDVSSESIPPAKISSLSKSNLTKNSIALSWIAPGDDGNVGTAASYDIRYATSTLTSTTWDFANQAISEPAPATAGTKQSFVLTGLRPATKYWVGIKAIDAAGNTALLSNIVSFTTARQTISNIRATIITASSAIISFTTNGDSFAYVDYGLTTAYGSQTDTFGPQKNFFIPLTDLTSSTTYHYRVTVTDPSGVVTISSDKTFST